MLAAVEQASASIEAEFVQAGERLESAIGVLGRLSQTFVSLRDELEGAALRHAADDFSHTAGCVSGIAAAQRDEQETLTLVGMLARAIDGRVQPMRKAIKAVDVLAINARIAAAALGAAGGEFENFLSDLGRPLKIARDRLNRFATELESLEQRARAAYAAGALFAKRQASTVETMPRHFAAGVATITVQRQRATRAATAIGSRSQQVRERVATAVAALQIGDSTRQRLEHVAEAIRMMTAQPVAESAAGARAVVVRLQAVQLRDIADELIRETRLIAGTLAELGRHADKIAELGRDAYAATDGRDRTFVRELLALVGDVNALLHGFAQARADAGQVMAAVLDGANRLLDHIGTITSLEADLRIMGLNTTLKCARLGAAGLPLSVIAQELRVYANQTAEEARFIIGDLEEMVAAAASLTGGVRPEFDGGELTRIMGQAVARLEVAEHSLSAALGALEEDSRSVAGLLAETRAGVEVNAALGQALHAAAAALDGVGAAHDAGDLREVDAPLLLAIEARYTMARERAVHHLVLHGRAPPAQQPIAAAVSAIDDMLF